MYDKIIPFQQKELFYGLFHQRGFDYLRQTYEAFILYKLFNGTVIRFDRQIKHAQFKDVYCPQNFIDEVSEKLEYCSGFVESHLSADHDSGQKACPKLLKQEIDFFHQLSNRFHKAKKSKPQISPVF